MAKLPKFGPKGGYNWQYCSLGGVTRILIKSGEDIAHLGELDKKLWTVLSCPISNLEFDSTTLKLIDTDADGRIRPEEIIAAANYLSAAVKDRDLLLKGESSINVSAFNPDTAEGQALIAAAEKVLAVVGGDARVIDFGVAAKAAELAKIVIELSDEQKASVYPYGDNTTAALAACETVDAKIKDYFMRCKLIAFDPEAAGALDVSVNKIAAISEGNLSAAAGDIASYPIARPCQGGELPLDAINPAWQGAVSAMKALVLKADAKTLSEDEWNGIMAGFAAFKDHSAALAQTTDESVASQLLTNFLYLYRDFFKLLRNYITFYDFYSPDADKKAIFEAGKLYIDQRCCNLCIKVTDMGAHANMAGLSGMFLIYCKCVSRAGGATMDIAAVMTEGSIRNLRPGKNAIFYDRKGGLWDATVTKIVDNPISIKQAFWAPYRKFWEFCIGLINKSAAEKDSKMTAELQNKAAAAADGKKDPKPAFDIAKFAGIFAAIGMAIGFIGQALVALATGIASLKFWQLLVVIAIIMLLISGPSCFIAWSKLRKRNLGPILNANGWAINAVVLINIKFGQTLTSTASYPHLKLKDPYKEETPLWKKITAWVVAVLVAGGAALYFTGNLACIGLDYQKGSVSRAVKGLGESFSADLQNAVNAGSSAADSLKVEETPAAK